MLHVVRSNRSEALVGPLAEVLRRPAPWLSPFDEQVVVVGADGMRRWLAKRLSEELGVCSQIEFLYPGTWLRAATREVLQAEARRRGQALSLPEPGQDPWRAEALTWAVLGELDQALASGRGPYEPLRHYLSEGGGEPDLGGVKAYLLARRIAAVFARYLEFRPGLLAGWSGGSLEGSQGQPWQPLLWRSLTKRLGAAHASPLEQQAALLAALRPAQVELPAALRRVCLFGVSSLPPRQVEALAALARHAELHLFALAPDRAGWEGLAAARPAWRALTPRSDGAWEPLDPAVVPGHPLVAGLGRLGREFQVLLERHLDYQDAGSAAYAPLPLESALVPPGVGPTLLARLQRDIQAGAAPSAPHPLDPRDDSLTLHACHGAMRQVEVLQDQLLELFQRDSSLRPSDVLILTPDVETFAPLIEAAFQTRASGQRLPVRIANRARRRENPLAEALLQILGLVGRRLSATRVLDLLGLEPVRRRFALEPEEVSAIGDWIRAVEVRWGRDAQDRAEQGLPAFEQNAWEWGLDRLLLGYALPGEERIVFGDRLPYDEVEGGDAALLGKLCEFTQALFRHLRACAERRRSLPEWGRALRELAADLIRADEDQVSQLEGLQEALELLVEDPRRSGFVRPVAHEVPRALLSEHFDQSRAATSFLTGAITVCGMVPLRSVGHRVVCLLGLDDGAFPRGGGGAAFDLAARRPALGDRSPREDDRYLFLEALLAARDAVRILYSGQSVKDNAPLPPSVVVSELLEALAGSFRLPGPPEESEPAARDRLCEWLRLRHPLQPFSPRYFGADEDPRLFSYATGYLAGAEALAGERGQPRPFWDAPLPDHAAPVEVELGELERFWVQPVAALARARLGLSYGRREEARSDREPLELGPLERYQVGARLLERLLAGVSPEQAEQAELRSGRLPPGTPGRCALSDLGTGARALADAILSARGAAPGATPASLELDLWLEPPGGAPARLVGRVGDCWSSGVVLHHYATSKAKYLLALWLRHLGRCAWGQPAESVLVTRFNEAPHFQRQVLRPLEPAQARGLLAELVARFREGCRRPLPFFAETSLAYARAFLAEAGDGDDEGAEWPARRAAERPWAGDSFAGRVGEQDDPFVARLLGPCQPWEVPGAGAREFHSLALAVYGPLLGALAEVSP